MVFAGLLDHLIRAHSNGAQDLDDVMFALRETGTNGAPARRLTRVTQEVTGLDIRELVERHIMQGEPVALPADSFGACGIVEQFERPRFVYGMEGRRNEAGEFVLVSVDPDGPAAAAGFAPGMTFEGRIGGSYGDASVDSVFRVRLEDGTVTEMSYRPTDGSVERGQHIIPADGDLQTNGCATLIAGRPLN
jgi:predicted metalloprotease with PDZ domain